MDHMLRLVKAWLMIGLFLSFLIYAALLIQSRPLEPLPGAAQSTAAEPPAGGTATSLPASSVPASSAPASSVPASSVPASSVPASTETTPSPTPDAVELTQFPGDDNRTQPNSVATGSDEPVVDEPANTPQTNAADEPTPPATQVATPPRAAEPAAEPFDQPIDNTTRVPAADPDAVTTAPRRDNAPATQLIGGGPLLNIELPDLEARLEQAEIDAYQRLTLTLPAGAVVSAPFAGEVVKTYLAPQTGYTVYLVSKDHNRVLMIGGLRKDQLAAAGSALPGGARLGLTAVTDVGEHLLYLQVRKLDNADAWWNGSLEDPRPYCRAWLTR